MEPGRDDLPEPDAVMPWGAIWVGANAVAMWNCWVGDAERAVLERMWEAS